MNVLDKFRRYLNRHTARVMDARRPEKPQMKVERDYSSRRRLGRFCIASSALECPDGLQALFDDMVILEARRQMHRDVTEYIAFHPSFPVLEEGVEIPEYIATFAPGSVTPTWGKPE